MAVKSWQLGYDATTGNFVELDDIASRDPNDPRVIGFENQVTALMEQKGLLASQAQWYIDNAYNQGTTLEGLKSTVQQKGTAEERGDVWGASGASTGKSFLEAEAARTDVVSKGTSKENAKQLINNLYTEGFGREADAEGLKYWSNALTKGDISYADIAKSFGASEEAQIRDVYHQEYGRDVDDAGLQYWMSHEDGATSALATIQDEGTLETQLRQAYGTHLGQFSTEAERQANIAAGGIWTDVQEGGYKNLDWTDYMEGTVTGTTDAEKIASAKASVTGVQEAGKTVTYDFGQESGVALAAENAGYTKDIYGSKEAARDAWMKDQEVSSFMLGKQYKNDWEDVHLDVGQGLSKGDQKTGLAKFQAAILSEEGYTNVNDPYRSKDGEQVTIRGGADGLEDVRNILAQREKVMHIGATYDKDDAEGGSGIGRTLTLEEIEPYMSSSKDLNELATKLGSKKWDVLTKELTKMLPDGWEKPVKGPTIYDPGIDFDERSTNRNTLSHDYSVPIPPDYTSNPTANVTRQEVDYMPTFDGSIPDTRTLRGFDSSKADEQFLNQVYKTNLGRGIGQEGRDYWGNQLEAGQSRDSIRSNIKLSDEAWLNKTYKDQLGRDLGDEGRAYWSNELKKGVTKDVVKAGIIASNEYKDVRNQQKFVPGTSAQGVRRKQSRSAASGMSALGTKQLSREHHRMRSQMPHTRGDKRKPSNLTITGAKSIMGPIPSSDKKNSKLISLNI